MNREIQPIIKRKSSIGSQLDRQKRQVDFLRHWGCIDFTSVPISEIVPEAKHLTNSAEDCTICSERTVASSKYSQAVRYCDLDRMYELGTTNSLGEYRLDETDLANHNSPFNVRLKFASPPQAFMAFKCFHELHTPKGKKKCLARIVKFFPESLCVYGHKGQSQPQLIAQKFTVYDLNDSFFKNPQYESKPEDSKEIGPTYPVVEMDSALTKLLMRTVLMESALDSLISSLKDATGPTAQEDIIAKAGKMIMNAPPFLATLYTRQTDSGEIRRYLKRRITK
jgi:hypothetical protein